MISAKYSINNKIFYSWVKKDYPFILINRNSFLCPHCNSDLIFVDGIEIIKHFRHKVKSNCDFEPESKEHLEMKFWLKRFIGLSDKDLMAALGA